MREVAQVQVARETWRVAKKRAIDEGRTLKELVDDALDQYLRRGTPTSRREGSAAGPGQVRRGKRSSTNRRRSGTAA